MDLKERYPRSLEFDRAIDQYRANLKAAFDRFGFNTETLRDIMEKDCISSLVGQEVVVSKTLEDFVTNVCNLEQHRGIYRVVLTENFITIYPVPPINWDYNVGIDLKEARYSANYVGGKFKDTKFVIPKDVLPSLSELPTLIASTPSTFAMSIREKELV